MKRILFNIILLSFTVFSWGQLPQTNLDVRWTSGYTNVGGKYYGIDSLTGVYNTSIEFIKCSPAQLSNITSGFVNAKDSTEIVLFEQDTVPITCLFWNYNDQDTLYLEMLEHTINSDSTENLPYRLASIAHYSTPTDARSYFSGIEITGTMLDVCPSGCTYSEPASAISAAISTDTIFIKTGIYLNNLIPSSKSLTLLGVGNSIIHPNSGRALRFLGINSYQNIYNLQLHSNNDISLYNSATLDSVNVRNCVTSGPSGVLSTGTGSLKYFNNINELGQLSWNNAKISECFFKKSTNQIAFAGNIYLYYNNFQESGTSLFTVGTTSQKMKMFDCITNGLIFPSSAISNSMLCELEKCEFHSSLTNDIIIYAYDYTGDVSFLIDSCEFIDSNFIYDRFIVINSPAKHTIIDCYSNYLNSRIAFDGIRGADGGKYDTVFISNNIINSNSGYSISVSDFNFYINNNIFESDSFASLLCQGFNQIVGGDILNNYITHKEQQLGTTYLMKIGNSLSLGKTRNVRVIGNSLKGMEYFGKPYNSGTHGLWFYATDTIDCRYNFIEGIFLGLVIKNNGQYLDSNMFSNNIIKNCAGGCVIRGAGKTNFINNQIITTTDTLGYSLYFDADPVYPTLFSDSCTIINNIFYCNNSYNDNQMIVFLTSNDTSGLIMKNNLFYSKDEEYFEIAGSGRTISQWESFGFYENSFNTNPNFKSATQLWPVYPSNAIGKGVNLGDAYKTGLDITTSWPDNIVTKNQYDLWTIGAYVINPNTVTNIRFNLTDKKTIIKCGNNQVSIK